MSGSGKITGRLSALRDGAAACGLALNEGQLDQFDRYLVLLLAWNQRLNLTAVTDPIQVQRRHFLDSLSCTLATGDLNGQRLIDVGSGAGFPGLPLKIAYPRMKLTLVESVAKKARFLELIVSELGLDEVSIQVERAEGLGQQAKHREGYDWAVARAVAALPVLLEYLLPLCQIGGRALAQKGKGAPAEVAAAATAIKILGGGPAQVIPVQVPNLAGEAVLVVVPKVRATPAPYPRRPGMATKRPL